MKNLLVNLLWFLRFHEIARLLFQRNKTTIIYYHDIAADLFEKHLAYLSKKYNIISLEDYVNKRVHPKLKYRLIITFDDGHRNNFELRHVLAKYQVPVTIFLVSNVMNTNKHFWFKWHKLDSASKEILKKSPNQTRVQLLLNEHQFDENQEHKDPQALSLEQINALKPWVSFQSHTHTHPCLNKCDDQASEFELHESKKQIEALLNAQVFALAFPNGDYEEKDVDLAKKLGYSCVLNSNAYFNSFNFDTFELKRLSVNDFSSIKELALRTSGVYRLLKKLM